MPVWSTLNLDKRWKGWRAAMWNLPSRLLSLIRPDDETCAIVFFCVRPAIESESLVTLAIAIASASRLSGLIGDLRMFPTAPVSKGTI